MKSKNLTVRHNPEDLKRWQKAAKRDGYVFDTPARKGEVKINAWINDVLNKESERARSKVK